MKTVNRVSPVLCPLCIVRTAADYCIIARTTAIDVIVFNVDVFKWSFGTSILNVKMYIQVLTVKTVHILRLSCLASRKDFLSNNLIIKTIVRCVLFYRQ